MSIAEKLIAKIPGSNNVKAFAAAVGITVVSGIPFFTGKADKRQGHSVFSSEKPEAVISVEEENRRKEIENLKRQS